MCKWQSIPAGGSTQWAGFDMYVEVPKGGTRTAKDGSWTVSDMPAHYGYLKGTKGADGEEMDVYLGGHPEESTVYVVDQIDAKTGKFDEHKVMAGFKSEEQAVKAYDRGFSDGKGPQRRGAVTAVPLDRFKTWVRNRAAKQPFAKIDAARGDNARGFFA